MLLFRVIRALVNPTRTAHVWAYIYQDSNLPESILITVQSVDEINQTTLSVKSDVENGANIEFPNIDTFALVSNSTKTIRSN